MKYLCKLKTRKPVDYGGIILVSCILLSCCLLYKNFLFGNDLFIYKDIGSDTKNSYFMYYNLYVNKAKEHFFNLYDFRNGLGANLMTGQMYAFDPFYVILLLVGLFHSPAAMGGALIYVNIIKICCSGLFCYLFLSSFHFSRFSKITASYIYAFNGFIMVWGQHYFFATFCVLLPLLLLGVERSLHDKRFFPFLCLIVAISLCFGIYFSYMSMLILVPYAILRYVQSEQPKNGKTIGRIFRDFALWILLGVGLSAIILLPSAYQMFMVSGRLNNEQSVVSRIWDTFISFYNPDTYRSTFFRFFSNNFQGIGTEFFGDVNYYETINISFSLLFLLVVPQFIYNIFHVQRPIRYRISSIIGCLLIAGGLLMPVFSLMFNGFAYPFQRHSFVFMPLFALILARTLDDMIIRKQMSRLLLCLTALFCAAVIIDRLRKLSNWPVSDGQKAMLTLTFSVMLACLAILFCCLFTSSYEVPKGLRNSLCIALVLTVGVSLFADNYRTVSNRETIKKDSLEMEELFGEDIQQALSYIQEQDASFYRVDKNFYSISFYLEALSQNYNGVCAYNSMLNGNLMEFKSKALNPAGFKSVLHSYNYYDTSLDLINMKYLLSDKELEKKNYKFLKQFGNIYVYRNLNTEQIGKFYTTAISTKEADKITNPKVLSTIMKYTVILDEPPPQYLSAIQNIKKTDQNEASIFISTSKDHGGKINGQVFTNENGLLFLSIPYEGGWTAKLNGQSVPIKRADYGFMCLEVPAGDNTLELCYSTPLLLPGAIISILSVGLLIVLLIVKNRKRKKANAEV